MNDALTSATIALDVVTGCLVLVAVAALVVGVVQAVRSGQAVDAANNATAAALRQAEASEAVVIASARQAEASERLAEEAQHNRELEWQPLLTYVEGVEWVRNVGRGPAYRVVVVTAGVQGGLFYTHPISLGRGDERTPMTGNHVDEVDAGIIPHGSSWAVYCKDQFNNRYQFRDKGFPPEIVRSEEPETPLWVAVWTHSEPPPDASGPGPLVAFIDD